MDNSLPTTLLNTDMPTFDDLTGIFSKLRTQMSPECKGPDEAACIAKKLQKQKATAIKQDKNDLDQLQANITAEQKGATDDKRLNKIQMDKYKEEAQKIKEKEEKAHKIISDKIKSLFIEILEGESLNDRMKDLYNIYLADNKKYKKGIDNYYATVETSDRKTYYQEQINENLEIWKIIVIILYWVIFIGYFISVMVVNRSEYKKIGAWIILIIFGLLPNLLLPAILTFFEQLLNLFQKN
jgi:hypothetical protein